MDEFELKHIINELKKVRGRHTELVTVYIPAGFNLNVILDHLNEELSTAQNIKSKQVRHNVMDAIAKILQELRKLNQTPENGLAVFCGYVGNDLKFWAIEPPKPLNIRLYRCDQEFVLDPLEKLIESDEKYGLIVIDNSEANIGLLNGKVIQNLKHIKSNVPSKMRAGGQSSVRFQRTRENLKKLYYKEVASYVVQLLGNKDIKGIILGGPGPAKENFMEYLPEEIKNKIIAIKDTGYTGEYGLQELVDRSRDVLREAAIMEEKRILEEFFTHLGKEDGFVIYGEKELKEYIKMGIVETAIVSEKVDSKKILEIKKLCEENNCNFKLVSTDTKEGMQFYNLGGFGGILRYSIGKS